MSRHEIRKLVIAIFITLAGAGFSQASSPRGGSGGGSGGGHHNSNDDNNNSSVTVTETEVEVALKGVGTQAAAKGRAESKLITIVNASTSTTTTNSLLTISVKRLTLADGATVTFQLNGNAIGTGSVKGGQARLRLSSKKGDVVPTVNQGDVLTVVDPDGTTTDLTGTAGAPQTHTEMCD